MVVVAVVPFLPMYHVSDNRMNYVLLLLTFSPPLMRANRENELPASEESNFLSPTLADPIEHPSDRSSFESFVHRDSLQRQPRREASKMGSLPSIAPHA